MHGTDSVIFALFLIFSGAALVSTVALFTRQSMLVAYMALGMLLGPFGLQLIPQSRFIDQTGDVGIMFLLFLLGLHLHPQKLLRMFGRTIGVTLISSLLFLVIGYLVAKAFGFTQSESIIVGAAMMFSSTIIGLKLLPTTVLHHQHTGEIVISILLIQDLLAIATLLFLNSSGTTHMTWVNILVVVAALPALLLLAYLFQRFILIKLLERFDRIPEYIFLLSIGWCLTMAQLAQVAGLSGEIGAFIAGVALAAHPISQYISENLKTLRDFFLVLFFFSIGAHFNVSYLHEIILPAVILAVAVLLLKPIIYKIILRQTHETRSVAWEVGWRLGQISEFSLLIAYVSEGSPLLGEKASYLIQAATILTFIASSYIVVIRYPTPLAFSDRLRRD